MHGTDLVDAVRDDTQTELSRLGSSKTIYADTRGEMEPETVLAAAAAREQAASETFDAWADDGAGDLFADAAAAAGDRLAALDADPADWTPAMHETLSGFETTDERLGGLVGWTLVDGNVKSQLSGFFTGQADPQTASTFRSARGDIEALRDRAVDRLDETCEDWDAAQAAATDVIATAYDEYFETLEELGVNPKPVC